MQHNQASFDSKASQLNSQCPVYNEDVWKKAKEFNEVKRSQSQSRANSRQKAGCNTASGQQHSSQSQSQYQCPLPPSQLPQARGEPRRPLAQFLHYQEQCQT